MSSLFHFSSFKLDSVADSRRRLYVTEHPLLQLSRRRRRREQLEILFPRTQTPELMCVLSYGQLEKETKKKKSTTLLLSGLRFSAF